MGSEAYTNTEGAQIGIDQRGTGIGGGAGSPGGAGGCHQRHPFNMLNASKAVTSRKTIRLLLIENLLFVTPSGFSRPTLIDDFQRRPM